MIPPPGRGAEVMSRAGIPRGVSETFKNQLCRQFRPESSNESSKFHSFLLCAEIRASLRPESDDGVFLRRHPRGDETREQGQTHTDQYQGDPAADRQHRGDIGNARERPQNQVDRDAESNL